MFLLTFQVFKNKINHLRRWSTPSRYQDWVRVKHAYPMATWTEVHSAVQSALWYKFIIIRKKQTYSIHSILITFSYMNWNP